MTVSQAFEDEMSRQVSAAQLELTEAEAAGDEGAALSALARLAELEELYARAADSTLLTTPSLR